MRLERATEKKCLILLRVDGGFPLEVGRSMALLHSDGHAFPLNIVDILSWRIGGRRRHLV